MTTLLAYLFFGFCAFSWLVGMLLIASMVLVAAGAMDPHACAIFHGKGG